MTDRMPVEVTNLDRYGSAEIPWSRPRDLLAASATQPNITFFLGTVRPDGRPHAAGIGPVNPVLDLRGKHFADLQARKACSQGFARNPSLHGHVQYVAIIDDDTPPFRAEQELLETDRIRFFVDAMSGE